MSSMEVELVRGRCSDCGGIELTRKGLQHVFDEMFKEFTVDSHMRKRSVAAVRPILTERIESVEILICDKYVNMLVDITADIIEGKDRKLTRKIGRLKDMRKRG